MKRKSLIKQSKGLSPPPKLTPSEWADRYRFLSAEDSPEPGKYSTKRAPYQKGILDSLGKHQKIVLMCSAQVGKTLCQTNALAYWIDYDPAPILWVAPTIQMAEATSKEKIQPMIRDTPKIGGLIDIKSRNSANTILQKKFPGGQVTLAGANSPSSLASRSIRYLLIDELDRYPLTVGIEGDPYKLASKRTTAYWNSVEFLVSTPTLTGVSRIAREFELSDQRHYYVPCPHCGHSQHLQWENLAYEGKGTDHPKLGDEDWIGYTCAGCGTLIEEKHKAAMLRQGQWTAHRESKTAGFHLNELYSPFKSWRDTALDFEEARNDPTTFQVWWNTSLGLPFEADETTKYDWQNLLYRAESSDYSMGSIPAEALILTAGVDVQGDRLECAVFGWGEGEQAFLIDYQVIYGDPLQDAVWDALFDFLGKQYRHPLGGKIKVIRAAIDTGYATHEVYGQIRKRKIALAVKGKDGDRQIIASPSKVEVNWRGQKIKRGIALYLVGVDTCKATLLSRCRIDRPGRKYLNLPQDISEYWCKGFAGSEVQVKKHKNGRPYWIWEKLEQVANEPLDTAVYAFAAAVHAGLTRFNWEKLRRSLTVSEEPEPEPTPTPEAAPTPKPPKRQRPRRPNSFINGFGNS